MKKFFSLSTALILGLAMTACSTDEGDTTNNDGGTTGGEEPTYEVRTLTFEDEDARFEPYTIEGCGATIATWSDLIDTPQYGGPLLYNDYATTGYRWHDAGNTELASELADGGPYWGGGHAVSNYWAADETTLSYTEQLTVTVGSEGAAGCNGSRNFCVQNGYVDASSWKTTLPSIYFADGVARVIESMWVTNTGYVLNSLKNGDSFSTAAGEATWYKIIATGYAEDGSSTTSEFLLCDGKDNIVSEWTKWDLTQLGAVVKIEFNIAGSEDLVGDYGLNTPAYFAYDNVAVRFDKE